MTGPSAQDQHPDHKETRRKEIDAKLHAVTARIAETTDEAIRMSLEKEAEEIRAERDAHA